MARKLFGSLNKLQGIAAFVLKNSIREVEKKEDERENVLNPLNRPNRDGASERPNCWYRKSATKCVCYGSVGWSDRLF